MRRARSRFWSFIAVCMGAWSAFGSVGRAQEDATAPPALAPSAQEPATPPGNAPQDDARARAREEAEIAAQLAQLQGAQANAPDGSAAGAATTPLAEDGGASASSRGLSNAMNPAISAVGITTAGGTSRSLHSENGAPDDLETGIAIQEVEVRASAIVDPFFRADVSIAGNADEIGFEEAYLTTLELPRVTLRVGQMLATVGRHNVLHTHAFPFITAPLPWRALLGPEGLRDPGVSADVLLPLPFYAELTGQVFSGEWAAFDGSADAPDQRRPSDFAYVGHAKTLFDLSDSTTLELGTSYVGGRNGFGEMTNVIAGDVTLKWKPIDAERYSGFDWTTEYVWVERDGAPIDHRRGGGYTAVRYQFGQQWWLQARGALLGLPDGSDDQTLRGEALLAFVPSEFSALRVQYAVERANHGDTDTIHELFAQAVFSIGPHPAHAY